jgi:hypothetical protein
MGLPDFGIIMLVAYFVNHKRPAERSWQGRKRRPGVPVGAPGVPVGAPGVTVGAPGVTVGAPGVTVGAPGVTVGAPGRSTQRSGQFGRWGLW